MTIANWNMLSNDDVRHIHLIAVCGTGMGALACLLKEIGFDVTGSDQHVYPPMSHFLKSKGINVFEGYEPHHLKPSPDLVVVGNAVSKNNPEVQAMNDLGLVYCSMPQAINRFAAAGKKQIVVTGTHGKTTTSSFIAWLLCCAGLDPSFLIGGIVSDFNSNFRLGSGDYIVLEGDEYDTAFFDKGPKFLHYVPDIAVLTSVEFDHADIFKDLEHVKETFGRLLSGLSNQSTLIAFDQDSNIESILPRSCGRVCMYGRDNVSSWRLGKFHIEPPFTRFEVYYEGFPWAECKTRMIGQHNLFNLLAGIASGVQLGVSKADIVKALETFKGVRRRQEIRGVKNDIIVIDDFAHHPTAVLETTNAIKSFYGDRRVVAIFEPRTNSSRRNIFQSVYPGAFDHADLICVRQPSLLDKIAIDKRFSSKQLVADLKSQGKQAFFFEDTDAIIEFILTHARSGDVLLIMSNGGFDDIHRRLIDAL